MKRSIETQIKINTVIVYLIVVALFVSIFAYIYSFRNNIDKQKKNIELYNAELLGAESLVQQINNAQGDVNLYVVTKDKSYEKSYEKSLHRLRASIDSIKSKTIIPSQVATLVTIDSLLSKKGEIVSQLNGILTQKDLLGDVNSFLKKYKPNELNTFFTFKTQVAIKDTVIAKPVKKKSFWKKMGDLFSSKTTIDTVKINAEKTEIMKEKKELEKMKDELTPKIKKYVQHASHDYISQLVEIEIKINDLVGADQEISSKISTLLINYYSQIIHARFDEIQQSDALIKQNNNYTMIGGLIALIPIILSLITILRNVNKGKRARLELENANAKIREIMDSRHQLLLSVSHDIKTPLNSIMGNLDMTKSGAVIDPADLHSMQNSGKHILSLLDNLLGFSSIEQGKLVLQKTPFHLSELCVEIQEMVSPLCKKKNLQFQTQFDFDEELVVDTDGLKLKQIIINLLSNAVKYTANGGVKLQVTYNNNNIHVQIQDSGVGINKEQLNKIFDPFVRVKENNSYAEGMGFGLYVVKGLVELFEGNIQVDSIVGKGTTFDVVIPANRISLDKAKVENKRILFIDDDSSLLSTLKSMTQQLGHQADACQSIQELKSKLSSEKYDLVVTDMDMGVVSGLDSLEAIRKISSDIPVVLMTARAEADSEKVKLMGFSSFLPKPISLDMLSILFGKSNSKPTRHEEYSGFEDKFPDLSQMLGNDKDAIQEVLTIFVENSKKDIQELESAIVNHDFDSAQHKCHKMLSMFMQINPQNFAIPLLKKMDSARGLDANYKGWEQDVKSIIGYTKELVDTISEYLK